MASKKSIPPPCNDDIFKNGKGVCVVSGACNDVEEWVQMIAKEANAQVDWHYSGGRANVLHLGDDESRQRVLAAIEKFAGELKGQILSVGGPALYRKGVENNPTAERCVFVELSSIDREPQAE